MSEPAFLTAQFYLRRETISAIFAITFDNPLDQVWTEVTRPDRLAVWLAPGQIELRLGGIARLDFEESGGMIDSSVTAIEPGRVLEYSWSGPGEPLRPLRWMLDPIGPMTRLTLELTMPANEDIARAAAGWSAHLEMLWAALMGVPVKFPFPAFKAAREAYRPQVDALFRESRAALV